MNKKLFLSCILIFICLCAAGCGKRSDVGKNDNFIYCLTREENGLIKIKYDMQKKDPKEAAESILKELGRPAEDIDYMPAIPENVKVNSVKVEGSVVYVDFSEGYQKIPLIKEKLVRAAVVKSLLRIDQIDGVYFTINGEPFVDREGILVGAINEDDFVLNMDASLSSYETASIVLYFSNEAGDKLIQDRTEIKYNSNIPLEKVIVEKLMSGPKKTGQYPMINPATTLLGVTIKDDMCYVNFDSGFLDSNYDVKPEVTIYSIVDALVDNTTAEQVQITVNGEKDVTYGNIDLSKTFRRDEQIIERKE